MSITQRAEQSKRLPHRRSHKVFVVEREGMKFTTGIRRLPDGGLAELFITTSKLGSGVDVVFRDSAILLSFGLSVGVAATIADLAGLECVR
jgi:hypothetical protein